MANQEHIFWKGRVLSLANARYRFRETGKRYVSYVPEIERRRYLHTYPAG